MKAPVQITDYRIKKLHFDITEEVDDFELEKASFSIDVDYELFKYEENPLRYKIDLFLKISPPVDDEMPMPFNFELILEGLFLFESEMDDDEKSYHLNISCTTMLYGAARNIIHQLTGQTNYGSVSIPSVQFSKIAGEKHNNATGIK